MSKWILTHAEYGTVGPLDIDTVLEGISDGRVPRETVARADGEDVFAPIAKIPVFALAIRDAKPPAEAAPFVGLLEADRETRARRAVTEIRADDTQRPPGDVEPITERQTPRRQQYGKGFVAVAFGCGVAVGFGVAAPLWVQARSNVPVERAMSLVQKVARSAVARSSLWVPPPKPVEIVTAPPPEPFEEPHPTESPVPPRAALRREAFPRVEPASTRTLEPDPLIAPLTPPMDAPVEEQPRSSPPPSPAPGF